VFIGWRRENFGAPAAPSRNSQQPQTEQQQTKQPGSRNSQG
jgi:hypothetical protein